MSDVLPEHIPYPGICNSDGSLSWHCGKCDGIMPILRPVCPVCRERRDHDLDPWVDLARRRGRPDDAPRDSLSDDDDDERRAPRRSAAFYRFIHSIPELRHGWQRDDQTYDLAALRELTADERTLVADLLTGANEFGWREVDALAVLSEFAADAPDDRKGALHGALKHHLSIDARLSAAEALHRMGRLEVPLENVIARELRQLSDPRNGCARALRMAAEHPTEQIQQALLWASWNHTDCAPACVATLMTLRGLPPDAALQQRLGLHNSYFTRKAAFDELCTRLGMTLDTTQWS